VILKVVSFTLCRMCVQHATMLLDAALENCSWDLARELVRFLMAIGSNLLCCFSYLREQLFMLKL